jgi:hypothetical protein
MSECEFCGETGKKIHKCKVCRAKFCEDCGLVDERLCMNCLDEGEFEDEEFDNFIKVRDVMLEYLDDNSLYKRPQRFNVDN